MTTNPALSALGSLIGVALAPVKNALVAGQTDPQAALQNLQGLAIGSLVNIPTLENDGISELCTLGLDLLAKIEGSIEGTTGVAAAIPPVAASTPAPTVAPTA